ncbi:MAG: 3-oxoacyl-ACP synthase [Deltaproteobacteria bacterium CG11_big_fil_rev_8_21_14_0_20_45_16]|nr:MAG: 3-oxoacyl-ACP synthase [Deltaproteobacteria bacterium CG11_big_fil_rev_8_21_14_0_20_45_16]
MSSKQRAQIKAIRNYFPQKKLTNKQLEKMVDTTDSWIRERTGIRERRLAETHETPSFMGAEAAKELLNDLSIDPMSIDCIVVATITGDYSFPASAALIQRIIGAKKAWGFDISAACSGYLYGLETTRAFVESGLYKNILFIAAEKMSSILDYTDRSTCILFGDAGSASFICQADSDENSVIIDSLLKMDGTGVEALYSPVGGSLKPLTEETIKAKEHYAKQDGRTVYKRAVVDMAEISLEVLKRNSLKASDLKLFVPHQANLRIIESAADRLGLPMDKVALNIEMHGNTTAATIPTALRQAELEGKVAKGDLVLLASFGAGFTWGATLLKY